MLNSFFPDSHSGVFFYIKKGLCFVAQKSIIKLMVILTEFGNATDVAVKTSVKRGVRPSQIPSITEGFIAQSQYRWGRMYSLVGKDKKLIRQF